MKNVLKFSGETFRLVSSSSSRAPDCSKLSHSSKWPPGNPHFLKSGLFPVNILFSLFMTHIATDMFGLYSFPSAFLSANLTNFYLFLLNFFLTLVIFLLRFEIFLFFPRNFDGFISLKCFVNGCYFILNLRIYND